jgi:hypothetical protein
MADATLADPYAAPASGGLIVCSYESLTPTVWTLCKDYSRNTTIGLVAVPTGFVWDGASVPRIFWNLIPAWGMWSGAALIHDFLYTTQPCNRRLADTIFLALMVQDDVSRWRAAMMFFAVRIFGARAWRKHQHIVDDHDTFGGDPGI